MSFLKFIFIFCLSSISKCQRSNKISGIFLTGGWNGVNQFVDPFSEDQARVVDFEVEPMWGPASAAYRNRVFIFGGRNRDGVSDQVQIYDPNLDTSFKGKAMLHPRRWHTATLLNALIYVCGGTDNNGEPMAACERYNVSEHSWQPIVDMPLARYAHAAVDINDRLMLIGGWDGSNFLGDLLEYSPIDNEWSNRRAHMAQPRMAAAAVSYNGHILVCGGWQLNQQRLQTCEIYSPYMNRWAYGPLMESARASHAMLLYNQAIFIVAGEDNELHMLDTIEHYDLVDNTSRLLNTRLVQPMRDFTAVAVGQTRRYY